VRSTLGRNVAANLLTSGSQIVVALVAVPLILHHVGIAGYGLWTIAQTLIIYVTTAEAGVGPAVQRFAAVHWGGADVAAVRRLMWTSLGFYALLGVIASVLCLVLAGPLADALGASAELLDDATQMLRLTGPVIAVALISTALGNVLQALERFVAFAASACAGAVAFLALAAVLLASGHGLRGLAVAALAQQTGMLLVRLFALRDLLLVGLPRLLRRREALDVASFSLRLQMNVLNVLVNSQTDKVVVGLTSSPATLGQLGIGSQVAEAGRLVAGAALTPLASRMAQVHGAANDQLDDLFRAFNRLWCLGIVGATAIGAVALYPLLTGWLGDGHGQAAGFGAILVVAYGIHLLSGTGTAYLRAVGRPGLEARYGMVLIAVNLVATIALGIATGAYGVVAATAVAYAGGTAWFFSRLLPQIPAGSMPSVAAMARNLAFAVVLGAAALGVGLLSIELLPTGLSLIPSALAAAAALAVYLLVLRANSDGADQLVAPSVGPAG
jgi:O-antigen/teichoic acid export membrane protein